MVASHDSPRSPEMMVKSQVALPSSPTSPQSPDMVGRHNHNNNPARAGDGNHRRGHGKKPPLAPPRPVPVEEHQESSSPPSHLHTLGSSEDLSFADFTNFDDEHGNFASLSGFLEEDGNNNKYYHDHNPAANSLVRRGGRGRCHKVAATDVASVGNASDTQISVHNTTGRDWHEKAKIAFNAGDYHAALPMFETILGAQVRRFSPLHPSVGAAMHNVGVSDSVSDGWNTRINCTGVVLRLVC